MFGGGDSGSFAKVPHDGDRVSKASSLLFPLTASPGSPWHPSSPLSAPQSSFIVLQMSPRPLPAPHGLHATDKFYAFLLKRAK